MGAPRSHRTVSQPRRRGARHGTEEPQPSHRSRSAAALKRTVLIHANHDQRSIILQLAPAELRHRRQNLLPQPRGAQRPPVLAPPQSAAGTQTPHVADSRPAECPSVTSNRQSPDRSCYLLVLIQPVRKNADHPAEARQKLHTPVAPHQQRQAMSRAFVAQPPIASLQHPIEHRHVSRLRSRPAQRLIHLRAQLRRRCRTPAQISAPRRATRSSASPRPCPCPKHRRCRAPSGRRPAETRRSSLRSPASTAATRSQSENPPAAASRPAAAAPGSRAPPPPRPSSRGSPPTAVSGRAALAAPRSDSLGMILPAYQPQRCRPDKIFASYGGFIGAQQKKGASPTGCALSRLTPLALR